MLKISDLPVATTLAGTEVVASELAGANLGVTPNQIARLAGAPRSAMKIVGRWWGQSFQKLTVGTDYSHTSRVKVVTKGSLSRIAMCWGHKTKGLQYEGGTTTGLGAAIVRATVELASGVTLPVTARGAKDMVVPAAADGFGVISDDVGCAVAAGSTIYARSFKRVPKPPSSPAATAVAGGALTTGTTYYYKLTTVDQGIEGNTSTEVSAAVSGSNLAVALSWTAPSYGQTINIYRSTTTGTEKFVTAVPIGQTSFTDVGTITPNAALSPPTGITIATDRYGFSTDTSNCQNGGGDGSDQTSATGAITGVTYNGSVFMATPSFMLGDDLANPSVALLGDSICAGVGVIGGGGDYQPQKVNWFDRSFVDGTFAGSINLGIGGAQIGGLFAGTHPCQFRLRALEHVDYIINELGTNDIATKTWQQIAAYHLVLAANAYGAGKRYVITTLLPKLTAPVTASALTLAGQTIGTNEAVRVAYNTWVRGGCQVDGTGAPVASGGTPSPYVWKTYDLAAPIEVNSAGVLTPNGGYWLVPSAADYTAQVLTGTPTATSLPVSTASYPVFANAAIGLGARTIKMTSGTLSGQTALIASNTATALTLYASGDTSLTGIAVTGLSAAPAAGDTFEIWSPNTVDGVHPSLAGHIVIGTDAAANLVPKLVPFGPMLG